MEIKLKEYQAMTERFRVLETEILTAVQTANCWQSKRI